MNILKDLNDLRHNNNFFYDFFNDVRDFNDSFFSYKHWIEVSFDNSIHDLKGAFN